MLPVDANDSGRSRATVFLPAETPAGMSRRDRRPFTELVMTRGRQAWLVSAVLFTLVNAVAAGFAAAGSEAMHAGAHFVGMFLGTYAVWRLARRSAAERSPTGGQTENRLEQLQQSVDVVALEVERLGEAQRFNAKLEAERAAVRR
jgi:hypothetical protein